MNEAHRRRRFVHVLATGTRRTEDFHANLRFVHVDVRRVHDGPHLHRRKTRLSATLVVERTDAYETVGAALGGHESVRVTAVNREFGRQDAGLGSLGNVVDLDRKAATLGPTGVHAQKDLRPVLGVDSPVFRVDLNYAVGFVVFAGEEAAHLESVELA